MKDMGGYSNRLKRNIRHVFWLHFALFAVLTAYIIKFAALDGASLAAHPMNPRIALVAAEVTRGRVLDSRGETLAESAAVADGVIRTYPGGADFAHIVGFASHGQSGVEATYNLALQRLDGEVLQRANNVLTGQPLMGNSLVLTVDAGLQRLAAEGLRGRKGAVVALEPSTGRVLAMASGPAFDPNALAEDWEALAADSEGSPLLNRAAQGLYPPGSVFKIVTAAAAMAADSEADSVAGSETGPEYSAFRYTCAGEAVFGGKRIRCFNNRAHGDVDITDAFAASCNTFFATLGVNAGPLALGAAAERLLFNAPPPFPLAHSSSSFVLNDGSTETELVETAIGQGRTLVTPLHMAMITAAVGYGGLMMEPYVADHALTAVGRVKDKRLPAAVGQVLSLEEADFIKDMMVAAVERGTASPAAISGVAVAGKTGTAENASGDDHGWFVAFAPADKPKVAVAVVLENSGGPREAMPIAKRMIEYVLREEEAS